MSIIDCFELFIEKPSRLTSSAQTWSQYKHNHTLKYLISITPQGLISFISQGWGGRTSDQKITKESGYLENLLADDLVLADRGFDISELVALKNAQVKIPAFTKGRAQLNAKEIESTRKIAHLRIHVERVIGVLCGKYRILNGTIPTEWLIRRENETVVTLDKVVRIACAMVNICPSLV